MKNLIAYKRSNGWMTTLMFIVCLTFMLIWLPFVRSIFDGKSYVWGTSYFGLDLGGAGVNVDFIYLTIQMIFYGILFYSFYWMKNRTAFYVLLGLWFINTFGNLLAYMVIEDDLMFHGDTLGVHISLAWIIIPLSILALLLIAKVIKDDMSSNTTEIKWNIKNTRLMLVVFGPLPIQAILLATGEPHGLTDQIGVIISISQCFLIPLFINPKAQKESR